MVQLKSASVENMVDVTREFVEAKGKVSANDLAIDQGLTVILAKERLAFNTRHLGRFPPQNLIITSLVPLLKVVMQAGPR